MIKLIGFKISGHSLFKDDTYFSLQTGGQITNKTRNRVIEFNKILTLNRVVGVVGINATGKSTLMNIFKGLNSLYLFDQSIDQTELKEAFRSNENLIEVEAQFASEDDQRFVVQTTFRHQKVVSENDEKSREWIISKEKVFAGEGRVSKSKYFDISKTRILLNRAELPEESKKLLSPKDSIFRAIIGKRRVSTVMSTVSMTNINVARTFDDTTPKELLEYLDNSIEYLTYEKDNEGKTINFKLKFKNSNEVITVSKFQEISHFLSSGTIKGITLFFEFLTALRFGATLLVDEIELHVNKQIVRDFIGFFADPEINVNNASLVYSTHYIELTDDLTRNDEEYVLVRKNRTEVIRLNNAVFRTELKNSELFQNNKLNGTAPNYSNYMALRKSLISHNPKSKTKQSS